MFVKSRMTSNPYTIAPDAPITDVMELMRDQGLKRVPVVSGDRVVGIVTTGDIQEVSPTKATALSIFEINYLLSKTKVSSAMTKELITVSPEALLEEAAVLMRSNRISSLLVTEDGDKLAGIITESDIFDAFIDLMGFRDFGSRITIEAEDAPGILFKIADIFKAYANITHIAVYRGSGGKSDVVIRINTLNTANLEKALEENGYRIVHMVKNEG